MRIPGRCLEGENHELRLANTHEPVRHPLASSSSPTVERVEPCKPLPRGKSAQRPGPNRTAGRAPLCAAMSGKPAVRIESVASESAPLLASDTYESNGFRWVH